LLQHPPHCLDMVGRPSPVTHRTQVTDLNHVAAAGARPGRRLGQLADEEMWRTARAFVRIEARGTTEEALCAPIRRDQVVCERSLAAP
jgi:hypothetical protein